MRGSRHLRAIRPPLLAIRSMPPIRSIPVILSVLSIMAAISIMVGCSPDLLQPEQRPPEPSSKASHRPQPDARPDGGAPCSRDDWAAAPDFDASHDTPPDIPIGVPGEDTEAGRDAGAVEVRYSCGWAPQRLEAPDGRPGDRFGEAFTVIRVPRTSYDGLVVGAPGRDVDGVRDAGALYFFKGTKKGLAYWKTVTMASKNVPGEVQAGARFGAVLDRATEFHPILVGLPSYDVETPTGTAEDAGAVLMFTVWGVNALYTQDSPGVPGHAERGDRFGATAIATDWTYKSRYAFDAGAPGEDDGDVRDAGAVFTCAGPMPREQTCTRITQDSPGIPGSSQAGDQFGAALARLPATRERPISPLYIGAPGEDLGQTVDAGRVTVQFEERPTRIIDQDSPNVSGHAEPGDRFGSALTVYEEFGPGSQHLLIGVPGEDMDEIRDSGYVNHLAIAPEAGTIEPQPGLHPALIGAAAPGNRFGAALGTYVEPASADVEALYPRHVIGAPGVDDGAGKVLVIDPGFEEGAQLYEQKSDPSEAGDGFGSAVNTID